MDVTFPVFLGAMIPLPCDSRAIQPFYDKTPASKSSSFFLTGGFIMAESKERPWRVGGVADLDLSICNLSIYSKLQTLPFTSETLPSRGHELLG
jgi:hypothetical protein